MPTKEALAIETLFRIADKDGNDVDFKLNSEQRRVDQYLSGRDVIPKGRQMGVSSYFLARYLIRCLSKRNTRAVIISHDVESTQRMLAKVHYYLDNIRGPEAVIKVSSKNALSFPKTNSVFYIGTAGARKFGRGDTITNLHCSEIAFWPDPKTLMTGLLQAVPMTGEVAVESTGQGVGNYYHRMCTRAAEGKGRFRLHFLNWLDFDEYNLKLTPEEEQKVIDSLDEDLEEPELFHKRGLTAGQILFRRLKLEDEFDNDLRDFKQEYPITLDECFQSTGHSLFPVVNYVPTDSWVRYDQYLYALEDDYKHRPSVYALGVDVGGGVRRDRSVIEVIDLIKWEQVAEWAGDNLPPDMLAERIKDIAEHWNDAFVTIESNNHGILTVKELTDIYPNSLIYQDKQDSDNIVHYGYRTTSKTKPLMIGQLRKELNPKKGNFIIHSPLLKNELSTFAEQDGGKLEAEEGCFDDRVMALAVGCVGATRAGYMIEQEDYQLQKAATRDPMSMEVIIEELTNKGDGHGDYPIARQDITPA